MLTMSALATAVLALLLSSEGEVRTSFPGGTLRIPPGCTGPTRIPMVVDAFLGEIQCSRTALSIAVFGGAMIGRACVAGDGRTLTDGQDTVRLLSPKGGSISICATERKSAKIGQLIRELAVDLGPAHLYASIRSPVDAIFVLQMAASFEPEAEVQ